MRGYLIANYVIHNEEIYQKYIAAASVLNVHFRPNAIVYDRNAKVVESGMKRVIAIAEFESLEAAERFYYSLEYQEAMKYRIASTEGSVLLAESSFDQYTITLLWVVSLGRLEERLTMAPNMAFLA